MDKNKEKHTPTPWRLSLDAGRILGDVTTVIASLEVSKYHMSKEENQDNAKLIVEAVNAYESLRAEVSKLKADNVRMKMTLEGVIAERHRIDDHTYGYVKECLGQIAQAEGRE